MFLSFLHDAYYQKFHFVTYFNVIFPDYENSYGPKCIGLTTSQRTRGQVPYSNNQNGQLQKPGPNQTESPTPSDISSIRLNSRNNVSTPSHSVASSEGNGNMTQRTDKSVFLEPGLVIKKEPWTQSYNVLPSLAHAGGQHANGDPADQGQGHPPSSAHSHCSLSNNSLSPFPAIEMSPTVSSFASRNHSAKSFAGRSMARKRASISPLSQEGLDLNMIIRTSPTSLVAYINGSRGSSTSVSPQPAPTNGYIGHLSARTSSGSPQYANSGQRYCLQHYNSQNQENVYEYLSMAALEQGVNGPMNNNHMVVQNSTSYHMGHTGSKNGTRMSSSVMYRQTDACNQQMPPPHTAQTSCSMPPPALPLPLPARPMSTDSAVVVVEQQAHLPPPPSYAEAVSHQAFSPSSQTNVFSEALSTCTNTADLEEDGVGHDRICKWIDCNQVFKEQDELVRHIEKQHIDQRKGEDFTCFWHSCPRKFKPFNARYKLLIHMRVHSGEKPNKCTVSTLI